MFYKYPRTPHLPWSLGKSDDDKVLKSIEHFKNEKVVATIKMDGENTTMYNDHLHARSIDSKDHESRHWIKSFHAGIKHLIPKDWRICGENLFAKHSIEYTDLESYFYGFSIWTDKNICLSHNETVKIFNDFGIITVPTFTICDIHDVDKEFHKQFDETCEGYVVRIQGEFKYEDFHKSVAKYVRNNHVQTNKHWMYQKVILNKLKCGRWA